jgi:hypothetical protein
MIPFLYAVTDDGNTVEVMEIDAPAELEALAHGFINRGGRYIITDHSDPLAVRIAAVVEGVNGGICELTSEMAVRGSEQNTVARLIFDSVRLIAPVN